MKTKGSGFATSLIVALVTVSPFFASAATILEQPIYDTEGEGGNYSLYQQVIGTGLSGQLASATFYLRPASISVYYGTDLVWLLECDRVQMDVGCNSIFSETHKLVEGGAPSFETFDFFPAFTFNPAKYYSIQVASPGGWPYGGNPPYQTHIFGSASSTFNGQPCMNCLNLSSIFFRLDDTYAPEDRLAEQTVVTATVSQLGYSGYPTQSFTPAQSGTIKSVAVAAPVACGVMVSDGQFATARYDSAQSIPGGSRFTGGAFPVTAGQTYYITFLCDEAFDMFSGTTVDSYPGGEAGQGNMPGAGDIHFASNASVGNTLLDWAFTVCTTINCSLTPSANAAPAVANLSQFREFGVDPIAPGAGFIGNAVVLKADVNDADSAQVTLEIELKRVDTPFDGTNLHATTTVITVGATSTIALPIDEIISLDDQYDGKNHQTFHWRARAVDAEGHASEWQEFAPATDSFTANVVPLWTQQESDFPVRFLPEDEWEGDIYAHADIKRFTCGTTIRGCGCAITSLVMLGHYYGIKQSITGGEITPRTINEWLKNNHGYSKDLSVLSDPIAYEKRNGGVVWDYGTAFLGGVPGTRKRTYFAMNYGVRFGDARIDASLEESRPAIAYNRTAKHYFVLDSVVHDAAGKTYTVRDPFWYDTRTLREPTPILHRVYAYNNTFEDANLFTRLDTAKVVQGAYISLASPAELIVTDPQGRRTGFDPRIGTTYEEIPGAEYYKEGEVATTEDVSETHFNKVVHLPEMLSGAYDIQVIGTGVGEYAVSSLVFAEDGSVRQESMVGETSVGAEAGYSLTYSTDASSVDLSASTQTLIDTLRQKIQNEVAHVKTRTALLLLLRTTQELVERQKYLLARLSVDATVLLVKKESGKNIPQPLATELLVLLKELKLSIPAN